VSERNVETVRGLLEPFGAVDVCTVDWGADAVREALAGSVSPDVRLKTLESGMGTGVRPDYSGIDGVLEYLGEWLEPFSEYRMESFDYIDAGDIVLVPSRHRGIGRGSGVQVEIEVTGLFEVRDGMIVLWAQYDTLEQAQEAAGL
jgi:ketosteroid isomerase-like protein